MIAQPSQWLSLETSLNPISNETLPGGENVPTMQETRVRSLGREDPLEKEMATHSSILAWRIPGTAKPSGLLSTGSHRVGHD